METVFLELLNRSISAGWLVLAVVLLRPLLRKAPKAIRCVLWALVGVRLVWPFSFESVLSLIPSTQTVPPEILYTDTPAIHSGVSILNSTVNPIISDSLAPQVGASVNPMQVITFVAAVVWLVGMVAMLLYTLVSYLRIRIRVREAVPLQGRSWLCDRIATPFILGIFRPRIYLPSTMQEADRVYVIAHETAHLQRRDHWWKPLGFLLLAVYWFNPLLWVAYVLLCRDIELACDEKVIRELGADSKKPYADALINCSVPRRMIAACPLAFGEVGVKARIKTVLHYKKPAFWIVLVAVLACVATAVCFLTDPRSEEEGKYGIVGTQSVAECENVEYAYLKGTINQQWPHISVQWTNNTEDTLCYGEEFTLYKDDEVCQPAEERVWDLTLRLVEPKGSAEEVYSLVGYDLSHGGHYRLEKTFYLKSDPNTQYRAYVRFTVDRTYSFLGIAYTGEKIVYENGSFSSVFYTDDSIPQYLIDDSRFHLLTTDWPSPSLSSTYYDIGELHELKLSKKNFDDRFTSEIWDNGYTAARLREDNRHAFYALDAEQERFYYLLEQKNGDIYIAYGHTESYIFRNVFRMKSQKTSSADTTSALLTYVCTESPDPLMPTLRLWTDEKRFVFSYSSLSSHQPRGSYEEEGDWLTLRDDTTDAVYKFMKVQDGYVFDMYESTALPSYRYEAGGEPRQPLTFFALFRPVTAASADTIPYTAYPVARVTWLEDSAVYTTALNTDKMYISSVRHLPIFRMESVRELAAFRTAHADWLTENFDRAVTQFDEDFFAKNTLLLVYVNSATCSETYVVEQVYGDGDSLCVGVYGNYYGMEDTALGAWILPVAVDKELVADCTSFDAVLNHTVYATENGTGTDANGDDTASTTSTAKDSLPFAMGVYENLRYGNGATSSEACILRSYEELVNYYNADYNPNAVRYIDGYDETFFEEKAIVLLRLPATSGSVRHRVDSLTRQGTRLTVVYTAIKPSPLTADLADWRLLLEVRQTDVAGVSEITPQQSLLTLPSGQTITDEMLGRTTLMTATNSTALTKPDTVKVNEAVIVQVLSDRILVQRTEGGYIHGNDSQFAAAEQYAFLLDAPGEFQVGDRVRIVHTGDFTKSIPPIGRLLAIDKIDG